MTDRQAVPETAERPEETRDPAPTPTPASVPFTAETPDAYDPSLEEEDEWAEEPLGELPVRPRRRLFGKSANPVVLTLLGVLLIACGFIGGVLVEKGQTSANASGSGAAGFASRFAALRGAASSGAPSATSSTAGAGAVGAGGGPLGDSGAGAGSVTVGEVAYLDGDTLYVTGAEGNTVKVTAAPGASVTKTVNTKVKEIHPGETVVVTGASNAHGAISAESIRVGGTGGRGGGLGTLFGGSSGGARGIGGTKGQEEPALFGKG